MNYLTPNDLEGVFEVIQNNYSQAQEVPDYRAVQKGMDSVAGVLDGVQANYYPTLLDKAAYILVQINSGHFFSNGNKRLGLVTTLCFLDKNGFELKPASKADYREVITQLFPE